MKTYPVVLTIAGSDSSGGAGIQADLKTMSAIGVFGASAITAITAQNTCEVRAIQGIEPDIVRQQIEAVLDDLPCTTVKLGMLYSRATIETIADCLQRYPLRNIVLDPVMVSTSGCRLIEEEAISAVKTLLLPQATVITPNIPEAEILSGLAIDSEKDMEKAANRLFQAGCRAVLVKGGHLKGAESCDILFMPNSVPVRYTSPRISTRNTHGTGCTFSSAIASYLALGHRLTDAVSLAKKYLTQALQTGADIAIGSGHGSVNHFFAPRVLTPLNPIKDENLYYSKGNRSPRQHFRKRVTRYATNLHRRYGYRHRQQAGSQK